VDPTAARTLAAVTADRASIFRLAKMRADPWQAELLRTRPPRTLALCSRQSGKSTAAAADVLATVLGEPGALCLILSPTLRQSQELFRKVVGLYRACGRPVPAVGLNKLGLELVNGSRVVALPGDPNSIVGFSAPRLVVLDEAARCPDELYLSVRPMLATGGGRLLCTSTPFGCRGFLHREWTEGGAGWCRVKVPAAMCPRIAPSFLEEERRALGPRWFGQEYELEFVDAVGQVFSHEDIVGAATDEAPLFLAA
jgi:hypothetical protein